MPKHGYNSSRLDFDGDAGRLIDEAYQISHEAQLPRLTQLERDVRNYYAVTDMGESGRDSSSPQVSLPKLFSIVENKSPKDSKALFGIRPVLSWGAKRDEFKQVADIQVEYIDDLLEKAGIYVEGSLLVKMKTLMGSAFMNTIPYYEPITEKILLPNGRIIKKESFRLRLKIETWASWEVLVDPFATTLARPDGCRFIIKIQLASKRMIRQMYEKGAYENFDIDKLESLRGGTTLSSSRAGGEHLGLQISRSYGLKFPEGDDDMGILLRYESPDRYIDSWMGEVTLRDGGNEFEHGMINLSKISHITPPHTQERFWGIGEAKPNEIQISMYDDLMNMTLGTHGLVNQPVVFFRDEAVNVDDLIWGMGQRIPVDSESDRPISDDVYVHSGSGLPTDHYALMERIERNIDLVAGEFEVQRGETATGGTDTLGEVAFLKEAGDSRHEQVIRIGEAEFLTDFALKTASIVEESSNFDDVAESVGEEKAMKAFTANPADLAGGYNMTFKGSDRIANLILKQQRMIQVAPIVSSAPAAKPDGIARMLLEINEFSVEEIDQMMYTEEEMDFIAQRQAQIAQEIGLAGAEAEQQNLDNGSGEIDGKNPEVTKRKNQREDASSVSSSQSTKVA